MDASSASVATGDFGTSIDDEDEIIDDKLH
jgi:hypothetical protein